MEISENYHISTNSNEGQYQAYLHKKTKVEGGISLGEPLYFSKKYPTEDQAFQDAKDFYDDNFAE